MAVEALKKVEDRLNCSICLDTYTDPKLLQCFHEYCQKCLVKLEARDQRGRRILTCLICRQVTPVPATGVAGLPPAFRINELLKIVEEHKKALIDPSASTSLVPRGKITVYCPEHDAKEVKLYCETCKELICLRCVIKGRKHHGHEYQELSEAFEKYKAETMALLEPMKKQRATIKKATARFDTCREKIYDQQTTIEADVHKSFRQLREILDARETEVIGQLHQLTQMKLKGLAVQTDQIETIKARLDSCVRFIRENLETENWGKALMMKEAIAKQVKDLSTELPPNLLQPNMEPDTVFSDSEKAPTVYMCSHYGEVHTSGSSNFLESHSKLEKAVHESSIIHTGKVSYLLV